MYQKWMYELTEFTRAPNPSENQLLTVAFVRILSPWQEKEEKYACFEITFNFTIIHQFLYECHLHLNHTEIIEIKFFQLHSLCKVGFHEI